MLRVSTTAVAFLLLAASLAAQDSAPSDQKTIALLVQQVKALQQETSDLREEMRKLKADRAAAPSAVPATETAAPQQPQATAEASVPESSPEMNAAMHDLHGI